MTNNSYICRYIAEHPESWKDDITSYGIKIKQDKDGLAIFNYDIDCDFSSPIVQEARGIIIDTDTVDVVCWPFRKFFNSTESHADPIDWNHARVQQKIDGSICKLWWNPKRNRWQWSTNGVIDASEVHISENTMSFYELIMKALEYTYIKEAEANGLLDRDYTYIFELVSPENQIVIHYDTTRLFSTGKRNNKTGAEEVPVIPGVTRPREYPLGTYDDCIKAAEALNTDSDEIRDEGFVVVDDSVKNTDGSWNRLKIKSPIYVSPHHAINNGVITPKRALEIILNEQQDDIPYSARTDSLLKWYEAQYAEFKYMVQQYIDYVRGLYEELGKDRKAVAVTIKDDALSSIGFRAINNDIKPDDIIKGLRKEFILDFIDEYRPKNIYQKRQKNTAEKDKERIK